MEQIRKVCHIHFNNLGQVVRCGLMVSALVSRSSGLGSSAVGARFVVFLDKTLNYHSASQWISANVILVFRRVSMHGCLRRFV